MFNFKEALKNLKQGYYVRNVNWDEDEFVYMIDGVCYTEEDDEIDTETFNPGDNELCFEFLEEECEEELVKEELNNSGIQEHGEQLKGSKNEDNKNVSVQKRTETIATVENGSVTQSLKNLEKSHLNEVENDTIKIKKNSTNDELKTEEKIQNTQENTAVSITPEIVSNRSSEYMQQENEIIHSSDLIEQSQNLNLVQSHSMNLIDDSANHLYSLMKNLVPKPDAREHTNSQVETSVRVAKELREVMKLKLETLKFAQELKSGKL